MKKARKNLEARSKEFAQLKAAGGMTINRQVDAAQKLTELAGERLEHLSEAAENYFRAQRLVLDDLHATTIAASEELLADQQEAMAKSALPGEAAYLHIRAMTLQIRIARVALLQDANGHKLEALSSFNDMLTEGILAQRASDFVVDAALKSLDTAIGLIPIVGNVYSAAKNGWELLRRKRRRIKAATTVVNALDDYILAVSVWISTADALIVEYAAIDV